MAAIALKMRPIIGRDRDTETRRRTQRRPPEGPFGGHMDDVGPALGPPRAQAPRCRQAELNPWVKRKRHSRKQNVLVQRGLRIGVLPRPHDLHLVSTLAKVTDRAANTQRHAVQLWRIR